VFADASALFAVMNRSDGFHGDAVAIQRRLATERWRLFLTNFTLAEAHGLLTGRVGRQAGLQLLEYALGPGVSLIRVQESDEERALSIIFGYTDKAFSYTDATSFAIMERLGIRYVFSFDDDFERYGFERLT
jgi:predicted nucleic acid-binding protein